MFEALSNWLFNRALRLSAASVKTLAKKTGQDPARIVAVNDAVAGIVTHEAVQAAMQAAPASVGMPSAKDGQAE